MKAARWALAALLATTACTGSGEPSPAPSPTSPVEVALGFTQLIPREGTRHALLRVENLDDADLEVDAVGLDWPGYAGGSPTPAEATVVAGRKLDIRLELPDPTCDRVGDEPVVGVVETEDGTIRQELEATGTTYVRRLWRTQCDVALVRSTVDLSYSDRWQVVGEGADAVALGDLVLRRRDSDDAVKVEAVDGSVLHGLRLPGPRRLGAGQARARIPLTITPGNRCDEHARGQATAPFDFRATLRIGDRAGIAFQLEVPLTAMDAATRALDLACAARAAR